MVPHTQVSQAKLLQHDESACEPAVVLPPARRLSGHFALAPLTMQQKPMRPENPSPLTLQLGAWDPARFQRLKEAVLKPEVFAYVCVGRSADDFSVGLQPAALEQPPRSPIEAVTINALRSPQVQVCAMPVCHCHYMGLPPKKQMPETCLLVFAEQGQAERCV